MKHLKKLLVKFLVNRYDSQPEEEPIDMTRQFTPEEMAELQARIEAGNRELAEFEAQQHHYVEEHLEPVEVEGPSSNEEDTNKESVLIL